MVATEHPPDPVKDPAKNSFHSTVDDKSSPKLSHCSRSEYYYGIPGKAIDAWPDVSDDAESITIKNDKGKTFTQYLEFPQALLIEDDDLHAGHYCIPQELLAFKPDYDNVFKYFFKGTAKEVVLRQIFFFTTLSDMEKTWLKEIRDYCRWKNFPLRQCVYPLLLRLCYFSWRKNGSGYLEKAYENLLNAINWRRQVFPVNPCNSELQEDCESGAMYWVARDRVFRPLLIVRLKKCPHRTPSRLKNLVIFCFEWAIRYLFLPGIVENCNVVFDVRGVPIHSLPLTALTDMLVILTNQYPFRLNQMLIINNSVIIQTAWSIAKQFLTEIQQQKMFFMRTGFEKELLKTYAAHHLEKEYGGIRPPITKFYPFPLLPGPFEPNSEGPRPDAVPDCYKAISKTARIGVYWEDDTDNKQFPWSIHAKQIFKQCNIPTSESMYYETETPSSWDSSENAESFRSSSSSAFRSTKEKQKEDTSSACSFHSFHENAVSLRYASSSFDAEPEKSLSVEDRMKYRCLVSIHDIAEVIEPNEKSSSFKEDVPLSVQFTEAIKRASQSRSNTQSLEYFSVIDQADACPYSNSESQVQSSKRIIEIDSNNNLKDAPFAADTSADSLYQGRKQNPYNSQNFDSGSTLKLNEMPNCNNAQANQQNNDLTHNLRAPKTPIFCRRCPLCPTKIRVPRDKSS